MKHTSWFKMFLILTVIIIICSPLNALDSSWTKISESNGISSYSRQTSSGGIYEIYSTGMVNAPIASVEAVLRDVSARPQYVYGCAETSYANIPGLKNTADIHYVYNKTNMPGFLSDRDCIVKSVWTIDRSSGTVYCSSESIKSSYRLAAGVVRMPRAVSQYTLIPRGAGKTIVICRALADPGGNIPSFVINLFTKSLGSNMIVGIRKMSAKAKYQNAQIITATPSEQQIAME